MGLLDFLTAPDNGNGVGGLLSYLQGPQYQSPLLQPSNVQQPTYDAMGNVTSPVGPAPNPFGDLPQLNQPSPAQFQPPSVFNSGAPGVSGLPSFGQPQAPVFAPQQPVAPPQATPAPAPAPSPENNPINTMDIGGYQMPQFGSTADYTPQPQVASRGPSTDISAQSRQPQQPPQDLPPALGGGSTGGNFGASVQSFANTPGGLINKLVGGGTALFTGQRSDPQGIDQQNKNAMFQSLKQTLEQAGLSKNEAASKAMLAVMNPAVGNPAVQEALSNKEKYQKVGSDALGNEQYAFVNERDQTVNGKPIGQSDASSSGSAGGFLAPGVKSIDSSLTGKDYLGQFSPEVQAAVQNYVDGKSMPTGNPRKGFTQTVKMIAQKYGADTNQTVDDATYGARRTMRNQLSSSAPSSLGGQINIGNTAAGHLADLTQKALELGNVDTGIAPLTSLVNNARGLGTEQAAKMEALKGAAQHYGQEITKFYAGSPGGVAERDRFIESVNGARSPKELAAILSTEGELMRSRLDALGGQIKGVLGEEGLKQYPVLRPDGQAALTKVEENVSRLKGGQGAPSTGGIPSGWSVKVR